jgi:hypothetical protein
MSHSGVPFLAVHDVRAQIHRIVGKDLLDQIGEVWSSDNGYTWAGYSVFQYNFTQDQESTFIGSQGGQNITVIASIAGYVNFWESWDSGSTWEGPYQISSVSGGEDGEMAMGCRGPIFTLDDHTNNFWQRRYDWYTSCQ